jgi:hypothetical protein
MGSDFDAHRAPLENEHVYCSGGLRPPMGSDFDAPSEPPQCESGSPNNRYAAEKKIKPRIVRMNTDFKKWHGGIRGANGAAKKQNPASRLARFSLFSANFSLLGSSVPI